MQSYPWLNKHIPHIQRLRTLPLCSALFALYAQFLFSPVSNATTIVALPSVQAPTSRLGHAAVLAQLATQYYDTESAFEPLNATFDGDTRFNDRLPQTLLPAVRQRQHLRLLNFQKQLSAIKREGLDGAGQMNYDCLAYAIKNKLTLRAFNEHLLPIKQIGSVPVTLAELASGQSVQAFNTPADYDRFLTRLAQLPAWTEQAIRNMRQGIAQHVVLPRPLVISTLPQLAALTSQEVKDHPYYAPVTHFPAHFSQAEQNRLRLAYRTTIEQKILPAMRVLARFIGQEYLSASRSSAGLGALPDGANWYTARANSATTGTLSADEIHTIGLAEVARIQNEFVLLGPQLGYDGPAKDLPRWIAEQEKYYPFTTEADILAAYRALNEKVLPQLPRLFGTLPKAALDIRLEPEISRATASNHYSGPAPDGSRPGIFWAVINDPKKNATTGMTTLFLHEGQPGHHFQVALTQELKLPAFRRQTETIAYIEGWALYAETLGHELGLYENDPNAYLGHLTGELLRAARLVVDTGLHAKGWGHKETIAYLQATLGYDLATAKTATERYMAWPGQALGYKIGALKIAELRQRAQAALGDKFDLRAFHDALLSDGSLPMPLLETKMAAWIKSQR